MDNSQILMATLLPQNKSGDGYLKFYLNQQSAAILAMNHTQEAVLISAESITPMPNMPHCVLGLMNWRSRIIWVIDLPKMLNLESLENRVHQYSVIVIKVESTILGLVVQEIKGITKFMSDEIRSPIGQVASSLVPYLRGCVTQQEENFLVLDAQAIVNSSVLIGNQNYQ
ncbi:CheW protein [Trichormus variabilis ATCC 29413]|uniref:CheW protein n=3 Tax=Anabaena variabilis TaxID=264691 RepID=Q3MH50_TRIV2|nr:MULTISPECIES: chemotaxis protein CheW [Nostocaceae]ABA19686.1 CheW protein [Trichormus variabilis ATCC 29413]MBC1213316.1 purine-binding chemotaxis protein CheW [Trichormus variabilis ARAD]MBC1265979.1 purine-binding chemotaxis protein CheW [Trichormus variabilis FSR]MBC1302924.1 purine-binding chemotaxis protein CheW [Trichormus variabilis N2B]MBC1312962.1 purine-binding chemotaxis protein CheW [Trichormus variabilis PNB]